MFFIIEEAKETVLNFLKGDVKVLAILSNVILLNTKYSLIFIDTK